MTHEYAFRRVEIAPHMSAVEVIHNGKHFGQMNLFPQMWWGYTTSKLRELLGGDAASDILNHGKTVILERSTPLIDFNVAPH